MNKITIVQKDVFDHIQSAVNKTVDIIKPTYGPASNKVIIRKVTHGFVVDDGVQIARDLEFEDPVENAVLKVVREVAVKTNDLVGDGTTGALIMLQAIINEIGKSPRYNGRQIEKELKKALAECKTQLLDFTVHIKSREDLRKVARISFDDEHISQIIADAWFDLGVDGVLTVDRSGTMNTSMELADGIKINRGYISPYMITNPQRMEAVIEKPYILLTDYRLTEANDVIGIMTQLFEKKITNLVIIAENVEGAALSTLTINKLQGKFNAVAINAPVGDPTFLEDIAIMTGGKVFSEKKGDKIDLCTIDDLGRAERFISKREESSIIGPKGKRATINKCIADLNTAVLEEANEKNKEELRKRIARFSRKIGVIKVGAPTENEINALKYKVEDAVNATHAAFKSGVVAGGGIALASLKTSSDILNAALQVPFRQLKINVGIEKHIELKPGEAINVVTEEIGKWTSIGVMDPVDVIIAQLESAISIASLLITTSGMIVEEQKHLQQEVN